MALSERGMTLEEGVHDLSDQVLIGDVFEVRDEAEVGVIRPQTGKRIDLDEVGATLRVVANVDAAAVATAQGAPRLERNTGGGFGLLVLCKADDHLVFPVLLVAVAVAVSDELVGADDLRHTQDAGIAAGAGNPDREFPARKKLLDQDRLAI